MLSDDVADGDEEDPPVARKFRLRSAGGDLSII